MDREWENRTVRMAWKVLATGRMEVPFAEMRRLEGEIGLKWGRTQETDFDSSPLQHRRTCQDGNRDRTGDLVLGQGSRGLRLSDLPKRCGGNT